MTGQIGDKFLIKGEGYTYISKNGEIKFDPAALGLEPAPVCTACWKGYFCEYVVENGEFILNKLFIHTAGDKYPEINGVKARGIENPGERCFGHCIYTDLGMKVDFNGTLIVGKDFMPKYYVHGGFQRMHAYGKVLELVFRKGVLVKETDISDKAEKMRLSLKGKGPLPFFEEE